MPPEPVARVLDTTWPGDLYAAGFLYGYTRALDLAQCGRIGSIAAAEVISHVGPLGRWSSCEPCCRDRGARTRRRHAGRLAAEPDDDVRGPEVQALLDGPDGALVERFAGRLSFGTAGLRAAVGAGPLRMNRLVVRQAARGLADFLGAEDPAAADRGVAVGYDARRKSDVFALDTARATPRPVCASTCCWCSLSTPVLAWAVTEIGAAAA